MNINRTYLSGAIAAACLFAVGCGGGDKADKTIAIVNGERISLEDFNKYMASKPTVRVQVQGEVVELPVGDTIAFQALQDLISRQTLFQIAKDEKVMPTDKEVDDEIAFQRKLNPEFVQTYQARGMGNKQIRDEIRFNLAQERLFTRGIEVSQEEVDRWIKENPQAFVDPATASLSVVLVRTPQEQAQVDKALESGRNFRDVAVQYSKMRDASMNQGKFNNGRPVPVRSLAPVVRDAVGKTGARQTTPWVKLPEGMAKFYVESKTADIELEKTPERLENVRRSLRIEKGKLANDLRKRLIERVRTGEIKIVGSDAYDQAWKRFVDMLNAQAGSSAAPAKEEAAPDAAKPAGN